MSRDERETDSDRDRSRSGLRKNAALVAALKRGQEPGEAVVEALERDERLTSDLHAALRLPACSDAGHGPGRAQRTPPPRPQAQGDWGLSRAGT